MSREYQEGKIRLAKLEVVVMPNGEIICSGKHIGWMDELMQRWGNTETRMKHFIEVIHDDVDLTSQFPSLTP